MAKTWKKVECPTYRIISEVQIISICGLIFLAQKCVIAQNNFFAECPHDSDVREGSSLVLNCQQSETRDVIYTWMCSKNRRGEITSPENDEFLSTPRRSFNSHGPAGHLTIRKVDRFEDDCNFNCVAHAKVSKVEESQAQQCGGAKVTVFYVESGMAVERIDKTTENHLGSSVKLRCRFDAKPTPTIFWYLNGKQLKMNSDASQFINISGDALTLQNINEKAAGTYSCHITQALIGEVRSQLPYVLNIRGHDLPVFHVAPSKKMVRYLNYGEPALLKCSTSKLLGSTRWYYFKNINPKTMSQMLPDGASPISDGSLKIQEYQPHMRGFYLCELNGTRVNASNDGGRELAYTNWTVRFLYEVITAENHQLDNEKNFEPPIQLSKPFILRENSTFTLRVFVNFATQANNSQNWAPEPILLWKNPAGDVLTPSGTVRVIHKRFLYLQHAQKSESGVYTLELENKAGVKKSEAKIVVACKKL